MRVFLSSTCYGLTDLRAELRNFINEEMGHEAVLSDEENFPLAAGLHRHEACVKAAEESDFLIAVIDRRYGAPYVRDNAISVTWAEIRAALTKQIPCLAFVRRQIWDERLSYLKNKDHCPSGYKPAHCDNSRTFDLIGELQQNESGIWFGFFENSTQIKTTIRSTKGLQTTPATTGIGGATQIPTTNKGIPSNFFSREQLGYLGVNGNASSPAQYVSIGDVKHASQSIPATSGMIGVVLDTDLSPPRPGSYEYVAPIRPAEDDGSSWYAVRGPTADGIRLRSEFNEILRRVGENPT